MNIPGRDDIYDVAVSDPRGELVDRTGMAADDIAQVTALMRALGALRRAEDDLSEASLRYMRLNRTDMRALHFLIACENRDAVATPGALAGHLGISSASTTKMLDRLERGGHVVRAAHPTDRRALSITITPETRRAAMETVGRQQAKRFYAAARLNHEERDIVIRFLDDMAAEIALADDAWGAKGERDL